ncbi:MAG: 5-formyltetrahydrofolate cyclo-ligase [Nitrospirales bacterium]|nr:5-formyltetrahydrofolate cyclo-ligase [Nitrospirales bacterium]
MNRPFGYHVLRQNGITMRKRFSKKDEARQAVWDRLQNERVARFPFPPHGRIPNFAGAEQAAKRLFELFPWKNAKRLKINPDAPQRPVREEALRRGIKVYVPTPRLRGGFMLFDPATIPLDQIRKATGLTTGKRWAKAVPLKKLPPMDAIVCGSVAVTRSGHRCGKGEGYSDLEYAMLRELGYPAVPVATTVHGVQILDEFPRDSNDLPLSVIVTPEETIRVRRSSKPPDGIDWTLLTEEDLEAMPVLLELKSLKPTSGRGRPSRPKR